MALIKWQTNAKKHMRAISNYYLEQAFKKVASDFQKTIFDGVEPLEKFPTMGMKDEELSTPGYELRFLIIKWRKRTYRVYYLYENEICAILAVWDCSMDPEKRMQYVIPLHMK